MLRVNPRFSRLVRQSSGTRAIPVALPQSVSAMLWWGALISLAWLLVMGGAVRGATIYVDSRLGSNSYDGQTATPAGETSGPVYSLDAAVALANTGDVIELANDGQTYYGSLTLFGARNSGLIGRPFTIDGHGATISGARPIPVGCWQRVTDGIWRITPIRKAYYQLVLDGATVPEVKCERSATSLPAIPPGQWCGFRGAVYYHPEPGADPNRLALSLADEQVGITLLDVDNVIIRDVTLQHFRLDGINAHDRCRRIELINVTLQANGRAGLAVGGTSRVLVRDSNLRENREAAVLVTELGEAELQGSKYDMPPTVVE
jgi:hypothetical protein